MSALPKLDIEPQKDWKEISRRKREQRESRLPKKWLIDLAEVPSEALDFTRLYADKDWLTVDELTITGMSVVQLATAIKDRSYTALSVVLAFAHRAAIAQQLVNCLTEINFEEAISEAKRLDELMDKTGQVVGPLHGIPISFKDQFHVKGLDTTMGWCAWAGRIAEQDSVVVTCLKQAGAIIISKTNVGQGLIMKESVNRVYGRTVNPYNRNLTSGGSSGGESALIALRGSAIGLGTDWGGSIREPAAWCGLYGLRPSWGRVSLKDVTVPFAGLETRRSTAGPMGHTPEDIDLYMSAYLAQNPWEMDPDVLSMPWTKEGLDTGTLCFAIAYGDEETTPHPPIMRGLETVAERLRQAGHIVVDWRGPLKTQELLDVGAELFMSGGREDILHAIASTHEPVYPKQAKKFGLDQPEAPSQTPSQYESWQLQLKKQKLVYWWHSTWRSTSTYSGTGRPIDGLIMPINVCVGIHHETGTETLYKAPSRNYCDAAVSLDITSAAFPTGLYQDPAIDLPRQISPKSEEDKRLQNAYGDPERWRGAPIGLQVVGQRLEEEKVVNMLCKIRDALVG